MDDLKDHGECGCNKSSHLLQESSWNLIGTSSFVGIETSQELQHTLPSDCDSRCCGEGALALVWCVWSILCGKNWGELMVQYGSLVLWISVQILVRAKRSNATTIAFLTLYGRVELAHFNIINKAVVEICQPALATIPTNISFFSTCRCCSCSSTVGETIVHSLCTLWNLTSKLNFFVVLFTAT